MTPQTLLLTLTALTLIYFLVQEQFFAPIPFCDRFAEVTVTAGQIRAVECTRNMAIGTGYTCDSTSIIQPNTAGYPDQQLFACRSPYRSGIDVQ